MTRLVRGTCELCGEDVCQNGGQPPLVCKDCRAEHDICGDVTMERHDSFEEMMAAIEQDEAPPAVLEQLHDPEEWRP